MFSQALPLLLLVLTGCDPGGWTLESQVRPLPPVAPDVHVEGRFVGPPVQGLAYLTDTREGVTDVHGAFDFVPGEWVTFYVGPVEIGSAPAHPLLTPLDLVPYGGADHPEVVGIARFLQSLDADGHPDDLVTIAPKTGALLASVVDRLGVAELDFGDPDEVDAVIHLVVTAASPDDVLHLVEVDEAEARDRLVHTAFAANGFRTNPAENPHGLSDKVRIDLVQSRVTAARVLPVLAVYLEALPGTSAMDVFAATSFDDGVSWERTNLSRSVAHTSWIKQDGRPYLGIARGPTVQVKGNHALVTWTSPWCPSDNPHGLSPEDDVHGVAGPQGMVDYGADGCDDDGGGHDGGGHDRAAILTGEVPYHCLWAARGVFDSDGTVTWFDAEQITSGVRDAYRDMPAGVPGAGFAIAWQEDPEGLQPGEAEGPGEGFGGAAITKGTDIWYAWIRWSDFGKVGAAGADGRPRPKVSFSPPIRVSDNAVEARTGAARASLFLVPSTLPDGKKSAEAVLAYEEKKAEAYSDEGREGKHAIFHHFERFDQPEAVSPGHLLDLPNADGIEENARRVKLMVQSRAQAGESGTLMVAMWRQGLEGHGAPADIVIRQAVGGYGFGHFEPEVINLSTVAATGEADCGGTWAWDPDLLGAGTSANPNEDARAHRGFLRGDQVLLGYTWTSDQAAALAGEDAYRFYVRRSFDGGANFTDPEGKAEAPLLVGDVPDCGATIDEPRLVPTLGTIKGPTGTPELAEDVQDPTTVHAAWHLSTNDGRRVPMAVYLSRSTDSGGTWEPWPPVEGDAPRWPLSVQGGSGSTQMRAVPDGSRIVVGWIERHFWTADPRFTTLSFDE